MTNFTVLAYRPNGYATCRGDVYDTTDSEFKFTMYDNVTDAAKYIASLRYEDTQPASRAKMSWEITLLVDGDANEHEYHEDTISQPFLNDAKMEAARLMEESNRRAEQLERARLEALRLQQAAAQDTKDRAEFFRLSAKFKDTPL